jgi:multidrug efflux pump subunit AcrA (membrane-fusion protein)
MNRLCVCILFSVFAVIAARAEETNTLPGTITVDGITYSNVTWRTVTPATVTIFHQTGIAAIPLEKLPPELQQRFGYVPRKAAEYQAQESAVAQQRMASAQAKERLRQKREAEAQEAARKEQETSEKQAKEQLEANQKLAARIEAIWLLCVAGPISPLATGRYVAQVTLTDQTTVCINFDEDGKRYLEAASRTYTDWKTRHDSLEQQRLAAAQPQAVTEMVSGSSNGGRIQWTQPVTHLVPGSDFHYTETPQPVSTVYGVREENSCYSLLGNREITQTGGIKSYSW